MVGREGASDSTRAGAGSSASAALTLGQLGLKYRPMATVPSAGPEGGGHLAARRRPSTPPHPAPDRLSGDVTEGRR